MWDLQFLLGNDTSYAAPAFFFDSFGSAGPIEVWLEKFDQDPAGRGWDLTHGVSWDDKTAPNHACGAPDDTTGSGSLRVRRAGGLRRHRWRGRTSP